MVLATVDVRAKLDSLLVHPPERPHTENLESTAIGKNWSGPAHKPVQPAQALHRGHAGPQIQMIGVAEYHLRTQIRYLFRCQRLNSGLGSHGHEGWSCHPAMGGHQLAKAGSSLGLLQAKGEGSFRHHTPKRLGKGWRYLATWKTAGRIENG